MKKFLPKTANNPQGFTLVELLVVISIIAVLSVVGLTVFSGVQQRARDAKRRGDIDAIAKAIEVKYNPQTGQYGALDCVKDFNAGTCPKDPRLTADYFGMPFDIGGTTFQICADLETEGTKLGTVQDGSDKDYCRKNQQ